MHFAHALNTFSIYVVNIGRNNTRTRGVDVPSVAGPDSSTLSIACRILLMACFKVELPKLNHSLTRPENFSEGCQKKKTVGCCTEMS